MPRFFQATNSCGTGKSINNQVTLSHSRNPAEKGSYVLSNGASEDTTMFP